MRHRWLHLVVTVMVALACGPITIGLYAQAASAAGTWSGSITTPGAPLGISVTLRQNAGAWTGTMDIPAQGGKGLALGDIAIEGAAVSFRLLAGAGNPTIKGRLSEDGSRISGTFTQSSVSFPVELVRGAASVSAPNRPQEPKRPFPYKEEAVTFRNESAQIRLAGTLTLPPGNGPFPAVLLITGSGAQDRDETIAGHKPFLVLSDHLTRNGVAVLRVDDRGIGESEFGSIAATSKDLAGDVLAGARYLRGRADVDAKRVGLIGHSEGANIAAMVAADSSEVSFIVMLAGSGLPGDQILYLQAAALARSQGAGNDTVAWDRSIRQSVYALIKSENDGRPDDARRRALIEGAPAAPGGAPGSGRELATALLVGSSGSWFRFFLAYDPAPTIRRVRVPVLAIIGDNDVQVPPGENLPAIRAALKSAGNRDFTVTSLPRLNHLFQTSTTGMPAEYATIEETMAPAALTVVSDWIRMRTR